MGSSVSWELGSSEMNSLSKMLIRRRITYAADIWWSGYRRTINSSERYRDLELILSFHTVQQYGTLMSHEDHTYDMANENVIQHDHDLWMLSFSVKL